jgi:competence protein ComEC
VRLEAFPRAAGAAGPNDGSIVLRLTYGAFRAILPGDLEAGGEAALLAASGPDAWRADVLKVAHHGSRGASGPAWLAAVRPRLAVVSAGAGNVHGHPHPATLGRLAAAGAVVARTDRDGAITIRTDGRSYAFEAEASGRRGAYRVGGPR